MTEVVEGTNYQTVSNEDVVFRHMSEWASYYFPSKNTSKKSVQEMKNVYTSLPRSTQEEWLKKGWWEFYMSF